MQNLNDILPLFCTPTWPSYHVSEHQEYDLASVAVRARGFFVLHHPLFCSGDVQGHLWNPMVNFPTIFSRLCVTARNVTSIAEPSYLILLIFYGLFFCLAAFSSSDTKKTLPKILYFIMCQERLHYGCCQRHFLVR